MKILVLSRREFVLTMHELEHVLQVGVAFISIFTEQEGSAPHIPSHLSLYTLLLDFHDIDEPFICVEKPDPAQGSYHGMSMDQAKEVVAFAEKHKAASLIIIHCAAGVSRSGAVGTFLAEYYGVDWREFARMNPQILPNQYVLKLLRIAAGEDFGEKYDEVFGGVEEEL